VNPKLCFGFVFFDCLRIKTNLECILGQIHTTETNPERILEQTHATETNPERTLERTHATETNPERIFINKKRTGASAPVLASPDAPSGEPSGFERFRETRQSFFISPHLGTLSQVHVISIYMFKSKPS